MRIFMMTISMFEYLTKKILSICYSMFYMNHKSQDNVFKAGSIAFKKKSEV